MIKFLGNITGSGNESDPAEQRCPHCDEEVPPDAEFCPECSQFLS